MPNRPNPPPASLPEMHAQPSDPTPPIAANASAPASHWLAELTRALHLQMRLQLQLSQHLLDALAAAQLRLLHAVGEAWQTGSHGGATGVSHARYPGPDRRRSSQVINFPDRRAAAASPPLVSAS